MLRSRKGNSGKIVATVFAGFVLILVSLYVVFYQPQSFGMDNNDGANSVKDAENLEIDEEIDPNTVSLEDAIMDLVSEGCTISDLTNMEVDPNNLDLNLFLEFSEFRKIAIQEELVFLYIEDDVGFLLIPYEGTYLMWLPEETKKQMEESERYTQFERIEIQTGRSTFVAGANGGWRIDLVIKNSGSAASMITRVFVNDVPVTLTDPAGTGFPNSSLGSVACDIIAAGRILEAGESAVIQIWIDDDYGLLSAGTTVNIKLHSAGGMDYIKLIRLE